MRLRTVKPEIPFIFLLVGFTAYSLWGAQFIPFHPDEATYLFMSRDFDLGLSDPLSLSWRPENTGDLRQQYRLLDAPLTRYYLGLGRTIAGLPPLPVDWDWSKDWDKNRAAGALPSQALLLAGRISMTLLLPFCLVLLFLIGKKVQSGWCGLAAALMFGTNALVLLHQRRAMAEGPLTLGILLAVWVMMAARDRPALVGLAVALAFNSKYSGAVLIPAGLLSVIVVGKGRFTPWKAALKNLAVCGVVGVGMTILLNPVLWSNPVQAALESWKARQTLVERQVSAIGSLDPQQILETPGKRLSVILLQIYLASPAASDVGNYVQETSASEALYLSIPGHHLFRGFAWAGIFLCLTIFAWIWVVLNRSEIGVARLQNYGLLAVTTFSVLAGLVITVPLPFQRYALPVVPLAILWSAVGLEGITRLVLSHIPMKKSDILMRGTGIQ